MVFEKSIRNVLQRKKAVQQLAFVAAAAATGALLPEKDAKLLSTAEPSFFTVGETKEGQTLLTITEAGLAATGAAQASANAPEAPKQEFKIEDSIAVPEVKRGGGTREEVYPFSKLNVGQSFFVAASTEMPNPAKSLASTVSSATRRYQEPALDNGKPVMEKYKNKQSEEKERQKMNKTREFTVRAVEGGARIWRTK